MNIVNIYIPPPFETNMRVSIEEKWGRGEGGDFYDVNAMKEAWIER